MVASFFRGIMLDSSHKHFTHKHCITIFLYLYFEEISRNYNTTLMALFNLNLDLMIVSALLLCTATMTHSTPSLPRKTLSALTRSSADSPSTRSSPPEPSAASPSPSDHPQQQADDQQSVLPFIHGFQIFLAIYLSIFGLLIIVVMVFLLFLFVKYIRSRCL